MHQNYQPRVFPRLWASNDKIFGDFSNSFQSFQCCELNDDTRVVLQLQHVVGKYHVRKVRQRHFSREPDKTSSKFSTFRKRLISKFSQAKLAIVSLIDAFFSLQALRTKDGSIFAEQLPSLAGHFLCLRRKPLDIFGLRVEARSRVATWAFHFGTNCWKSYVILGFQDQ